MTDDPGTERTLLLLRHAKAESPRGVPDVDRPLSARGETDASAVGAWLARHTLLPDVVLCSPARRTRETWQSVAVGMTGDPPEGGPAGATPVVRAEAGIYQALPQTLLALLRTVPSTATTVLLVGHNPGVSLLSGLLDPAGVPVELRTAELATHRFRGPWSTLAAGRAPRNR
ncbi:SixA phosphatase family protein [Micromonospora yangpuensis]|uniref:Phosphohistidine phosphatase n=1 Tax=Micromonospora yangpuensis TaxID=683228 RepID=A0A1C6TX81_9ACTN|nr:histidine phosphatase family protein [Micromonospora yangpuensis]GGM01947.1 phosphoglycerate mutase [Micromonospora yangpuensis]SCL46420.1 phosphohistidine phosphatase [Micromonospora yangpuensis]